MFEASFWYYAMRWWDDFGTRRYGIQPEKKNEISTDKTVFFAYLVVFSSFNLFVENFVLFFLLYKIH